MWTLSAYRKTVRLAVPSLRITGMPEPLAVYMDFDAVTVDAMLERLSILHGKMLPPLPAPVSGWPVPPPAAPAPGRRPAPRP